LINLDDIQQEYIKHSHKIGHKSVSIISCAEINYKNHHFNIEHLLRIALALDVNVTVFFEGVDKQN